MAMALTRALTVMELTENWLVSESPGRIRVTALTFTVGAGMYESIRFGYLIELDGFMLVVPGQM